MVTPGFWDGRYSGQDYFYGTEPNEFLVSRSDDFLAGGKLLCLGDGEGRNSVFLAGQGFAVTAMDLSAAGLEKASKLAAERGVRIETQVGDLNDFELGDRAWDGIVSIWCHLPSLLRQKVHLGCQRALKPGGLFLLEAYRPAQIERDTGGPKDVDMLPTADLLGRELSSLQPLLVHEIEREVLEGPGHTGSSAVVQWIGRKLR